MKIKNILTLVIAIFISSLAMSQNDPVCFSYDFAGNRISRTVCISKTDSINNNKEIEPICISNAPNKIDIYPNPTDGKFSVVIYDIGEEELATLRLFSMSGNLLYETKNNNSETIIDIGDKEPGSYILYILLKGAVKTVKIIKQ